MPNVVLRQNKKADERRDFRIDSMRAIGILSVVLAHSRAENEWIAQLRIFDVVLLVLLLGNSFYISSINKKLDYIKYVQKRFSKLVIQTWLFLTIFFLLFFFISVYSNQNYYFTRRVIIRSYLLLDGIGYVWIMRVFFLVALISPFLLEISSRINNDFVYLIFVCGGYLFYIFLLYVNSNLSGLLHLIFSNFIIYGFSYSLIAAVGIRIPTLNKKGIFFYAFFFLSAFVFLTFSQGYFPLELQQNKYPPQIYYLSYGLFMSLMLNLLFNIKFVATIFNNEFVRFLSKSSAWLYFWHIIPVYIIQFYGTSIPIISKYSLTRFLFILLIAVFITFAHNVVKLFYKEKVLGSLQKLPF